MKGMKMWPWYIVGGLLEIGILLYLYVAIARLLGFE